MRPNRSMTASTAAGRLPDREVADPRRPTVVREAGLRRELGEALSVRPDQAESCAARREYPGRHPPERTGRAGDEDDGIGGHRGSHDLSIVQAADRIAGILEGMTDRPARDLAVLAERYWQAFLAFEPVYATDLGAAVTTIAWMTDRVAIEANERSSAGIASASAAIRARIVRWPSIAASDRSSRRSS